MKLMREIRFSLSSRTGKRLNTFGGWPGARPGAPFMRMQAVVCGDIDRPSGYLCNIKLIDQVLREHAVPPLIETWTTPHRHDPAETAIRRCWQAVDRALPVVTRLLELRLEVTPFLTYCITSGEDTMVTVTVCFEFCAAHRLFCPEFSEQKNRQLFGKCANPNGHGHNYQLEVTVAGQPDSHSGTIIEIERFEHVVKETVIDRFDHKHLNLDCSEFRELNPSVENITTVIWDLLEGKFSPARLSRLRVWETPKTYAELER